MLTKHLLVVLSSPVLPFLPSTDLPWSAVGEGDALSALLIKIWFVRTTLWVTAWKIKQSILSLSYIDTGKHINTSTKYRFDPQMNEIPVWVFFLLPVIFPSPLFTSLSKVLVYICQQIIILCKFILNGVLSLHIFKGSRQMMLWMAPSCRKLPRHGQWASGTDGITFQSPWGFRYFKTRLVAATPKNCIKVKEELPSKLYSKFPHFPCGFLQVLRQGAPQGL